jgi:hypothetical protein
VLFAADVNYFNESSFKQLGGFVFALDLVTGKQQWNFSVPCPPG